MKNGCSRQFIILIVRSFRLMILLIIPATNCILYYLPFLSPSFCIMGFFLLFLSIIADERQMIRYLSFVSRVFFSISHTRHRNSGRRGGECSDMNFYKESVNIFSPQTLINKKRIRQLVHSHFRNLSLPPLQ